MTTKRSGFGHIVFGVFLAMFVYYAGMPIFNTAVNIIFNYTVVPYAAYFLTLLTAAPMLFIACRKKVPAIIFAAVNLVAVIGCIALAIIETGTVYFSLQTIVISVAFAVFMLIGSFLSGNGAKGLGIAVLIVGILAAAASMVLSLINIRGDYIGFRLWETAFNSGFAGLFQTANVLSYYGSTMLAYFPFSVSLSFLTLATALLAPGKETAAVPTGAPNVIMVDANGVPIRPGVNPGMNQGFSSAAPQQAYNPNAAQQGFNRPVQQPAYTAPVQQPAQPVNPAPVHQPVNTAPAQQPASAPQEEAPIDVNAEMKKLTRLRDTGAITEAEFNARKADILSKL